MGLSAESSGPYAFVFSLLIAYPVCGDFFGLKTVRYLYASVASFISLKGEARSRYLEHHGTQEEEVHSDE